MHRKFNSHDPSLRILGLWQFPSPRDPFPGSSVSGSHVSELHFQDPGCQGPVSRVPGYRVGESRVSGSQVPRILSRRVLSVMVPGSRVSGSWSPGPQVLILDYANKIDFNESNFSYIFPIESSKAFPRSYSSNDIFASPILVFDWLIFCCKNYILHQKKKLK